jgi:hypothetical protein
MADVESIQKELEEVKKRLATVIAKDRAPVEPKVIFAPRERKLQKFSGQKDDRSVEEYHCETRRKFCKLYQDTLAHIFKDEFRFNI